MNSSNSSLLTGGGVVIDIGTGDGTFVYQSARLNPRKFYIGVDASARPLEKISEKIHRKPAKGGLSNALFVEAAVENLPDELNGVGDEVHVHFPWGSLLRAVATGEPGVLSNLRRICAPEGVLEVVIGLDPERDCVEMQRLGVPAVTIESIDTVLQPRYKSAHFEIFDRGVLSRDDWSQIETAWAKRLSSGSGRTVTYFLARAVKR